MGDVPEFLSTPQLAQQVWGEVMAGGHVPASLGDRVTLRGAAVKVLEVMRLRERVLKGGFHQKREGKVRGQHG